MQPNFSIENSKSASTGGVVLFVGFDKTRVYPVYLLGEDVMGLEHFVQDTIEEFCAEFIEQPYIYYTEHGLHARVYLMLYNNLPKSNRYLYFNNEEVCIIQKNILLRMIWEEVEGRTEI